VCEAVNFKRGEVITVFLAPVKEGADLKLPELGRPIVVAKRILFDRNAIEKNGRVKFYNAAVTDVTDASTRTDNDNMYYDYTYTSEQITQRGEDVNLNDDRVIFSKRVNMGSTAVRDGFFYSINASAPAAIWPEVKADMERVISSFHLTPKSDNYVKPGSDWWKFF